MGIKIVNMWRPYQADSPPWAKWLTAFCYLPVAIFGLAGLIWSVGRWREFFPVIVFIAYMFLVHAVTLGNIRYRYSVMPFLMIFSAYALIKLWRRVNINVFLEREEVTPRS
jgi:hypothetical protein